MGRKSRQQQNAEYTAEYWKRSEQDGHHFALVWNIDGLAYGPRCFETLEEAQAACDAAGAEYLKEIPMDYYDRRARLVTFKVWIEQFRSGKWEPIADSEREAYRVDYLP